MLPQCPLGAVRAAVKGGRDVRRVFDFNLAISGLLEPRSRGSFFDRAGALRCLGGDVRRGRVAAVGVERV